VLKDPAQCLGIYRTCASGTEWWSAKRDLATDDPNAEAPSTRLPRGLVCTIVRNSCGTVAGSKCFREGLIIDNLRKSSIQEVGVMRDGENYNVPVGVHLQMRPIRLYSCASLPATSASNFQLQSSKASEPRKD
jgi:hypothetical protein